MIAIYDDNAKDCDADRCDAIWCVPLTVGDAAEESQIQYGYVESTFGKLRDTSIVHAGDTYTVEKLKIVDLILGTDQVAVELDGFVPRTKVFKFRRRRNLQPTPIPNNHNDGKVRRDPPGRHVVGCGPDDHGERQLPQQPRYRQAVHFRNGA